jgi:hypothetical protein
VSPAVSSQAELASAFSSPAIRFFASQGTLADPTKTIVLKTAQGIYRSTDVRYIPVKGSWINEIDSIAAYLPNGS